MKIKPEHFEHMKTTIDGYLKRHEGIIGLYEQGLFVRSDRVKDLQTRFNFDLMYMAGLTRYVCDNIYPYANDDHVMTALKRICPKVERKY